MTLIRTLQFIVNHPLNRSHKSRALLGFVKWQIGSRLVPGPVAFQWLEGARILVRPGEAGVTQNVYCGLHDFQDMAYLLHVMTPEDFFVDIGSNVGSYTVLACAARGARGYCFEPVPATFARLLDNIKLNGLSSRVVALNIGLSDREGELAFTTGEDCGNHVLGAGEAASGSVKVPVHTLDSVLSGLSPSFLKIDVEGFESAVLGGAEATLGNPSLRSILIELNEAGARYGFDESFIFQKLKSFGFLPYEYEPYSRSLHPLAGKNTGGNNTLFLRDLNAIRERVASAAKVIAGLNEF